MRKTIITLLALLFSVSMVYGQKTGANGTENSRAEAMIFQQKGPSRFTGLIRSIYINAQGRVFIGLAGGGIWYSDDNGTTWNSLDAFNRALPYDEQNLVVSKIFEDPDDPNKILVATGDIARTFSSDLTAEPHLLSTFSSYQRWAVGYPGNGIYRSTDGGKTFSHIPTTKRNSYKDPWTCVTDIKKSGNRYFIATLRGFYFTDDDFATLKQTPNVASSVPAVFKSKLDTGKIYDIAVLNNGRILLSTGSGILELSQNGDSLLNYYRRMADDGTLSPSSGTNIASGGARTYFAVSPKDKNKVYIMAVASSGVLAGVWKSVDNGNTWDRLAPYSNALFAPLGGEGILASVITVDPQNDDVIYVGGATWVKYDPFTKTWIQEWSGNYLFPGYLKYVGTELTAAAFAPNNPNILFIGGTHTLVFSTDGGNTFHEIQNFTTCFTDFIARTANKKNFASGAFVNTLINASIANISYNDLLEVEPSAGDFAGSVYNADHIIRGGKFGQIKRSINGGDAFEYFWGYPDSVTNYADLTNIEDSLIHDEDNLPGDRALSPDVLSFARVTSLYNTPFVLTEVKKDSLIVVDTLGRYLYPSFVIALLPPKRKIDSNGGIKWALWRASNPFGRGPADSLSKWVRISPSLILKSSTIGVKEGPTAAAQADDPNRTTFFGTSLGQLFRLTKPTDLQNVTYTLIEGDDGNNNIDNLPDKMISDIAIHPTNPDIVAVSFASYDTTGGYLYISFNATSPNPTFTRITTIPLVPVYTVAFNPINPDRILMVGTEKGLWVINDISAGSAFPAVNITDDVLFNVPIKDIKFHEWNIYKEVVRQENDQEIVQYRLRKDPWPRCLIATDGLGILETYVGNVVGIDNQFFFTENNKVNITLFPNPATGDKVNLAIQTQTKKHKQAIIKIYDIKGNLVYLDTWNFQDIRKGTVDISRMGSGMYFVNIVVPEENFATSEKLIIKK